MARREIFMHSVEATFHSCAEKSSKATGNAKVFSKLLSCSQRMMLSNLGSGVVLLPSNSLSSPLIQQVSMNPSWCARAGNSSRKPGTTGLGELAGGAGSSYNASVQEKVDRAEQCWVLEVGCGGGSGMECGHEE